LSLLASPCGVRPAVGFLARRPPGFRVLGIATTAIEALCRFDTAPADVALVDLALPGAHGLDLTAQIKARCPAARVVVIADCQSPARCASAVEAGADDSLSKNVPLADLLSALRDQAGQSLTSQHDLSASERATRSPSAEAPELTLREREVLDLLGKGRPTKRIAQDLGIRVSTCRAHIRAIYGKLDVHS
jgi:DNA-binding NarL/FixJ family response regulator